MSTVCGSWRTLVKYYECMTYDRLAHLPINKTTYYDTFYINRRQKDRGLAKLRRTSWKLVGWIVLRILRHFKYLSHIATLKIHSLWKWRCGPWPLYPQAKSLTTTPPPLHHDCHSSGRVVAVVLRIYVASAAFQPYCDLKQEIVNLSNSSGEAGNRTSNLLHRKPRA